MANIIVNQPGTTNTTLLGVNTTAAAVAQSILTPSAFRVGGITLKLNKSGAPTDNLAVRIYSDQGITLLGTSNTIAGSLISATATDYTFTFSPAISLASGTAYYFAISRSGAVDAVNFYNVSKDQATSSYAGGDRYVINGSGVWSVPQITDLYFLVADDIGPKSFYLNNVAATGSNYGQLQEGTSPAITAAVTTTGWVPARLTAPNYALMDFGAELASTAFVTTDLLSTTALNNTTGNAWRSESTYNGSFANANWTFALTFRPTTITPIGRPRIQLWKGSNANGSGATRIGTASAAAAGQSLNSTATTFTFSSTVNPGAQTFTNEYLFVQVEWETTGTGSANANNVRFYLAGTAATAAVLTADFTPAITSVNGNASGAILAATASLVAGTASAAQNGNANGGAVTVAASLVTGAAIGAAAASGAVVSDAASLASGTAAGAATQAGATQSVTATVSGGIGAGAATASGATPTATTALVAGSASGTAVLNGNASGSTITLGASLITGAASGVAATSGATLTATATPLAGTAAGQGAGAGSLLAVSTSLIAGSASGAGAGEVIAQGTTVEATTSLVTGTATGTTEVTVIFGGGGRFNERREDAVAHGETITCFARLVAGQASTVSLLAGAALGDAIAANDNLEAFALMLPGTATGERNFADDELLMIFAEAA